MAVITNNLSGSTSNGSKVGITGSVIIANVPGSSFPALPGSDTVFFVSGSNTEKSAFGGTLAVSGALEVKNSLDISSSPGVVTYIDSKNFLNISANGGGVDINDGGNVRLLSPTVKIGSSFYNVDVGSDASFYVSGSSANKSVFGGDLVVSGSSVSLGGVTISGDLFEVTGTLAVTGGISGSLTHLSDGTSYLIAGDNISIVSSSGGSISIGTTTSITSSFSGSYSTTTRSFTGSGPFTAPLKGFILTEVNADPTTVYLPSGAPDGFQVTVKRNDASPNSNSLWVSGSNSDGIDGSLGVKIDSNWGAMNFVKLGSTWYTT